MSRIERFIEAQDADSAFESALAEVKTGRKRGHWIWFVFPQLSGLGRSGFSQTYGISDLDEAVEYLQHPVLGSRLMTITKAAAEQMRHGVSLETLMGAAIDALKLVSSLTLFGHVAGHLDEANGNHRYEAFGRLAEEILTAAAAQGYPRCRYTRARLGAVKP